MRCGLWGGFACMFWSFPSVLVVASRDALVLAVTLGRPDGAEIGSNVPSGGALVPSVRPFGPAVRNMSVRRSERTQVRSDLRDLLVAQRRRGEARHAGGALTDPLEDRRGGRAGARLRHRAAGRFEGMAGDAPGRHVEHR